MGMAASQARLLQITSRLHDIEYSAQNIESQKIALATQKDELYQKYNDALDAKKIQVAFLDSSAKKYYVDANFSTVCGYDASRCTQYTLTDSKTGKVYITDEEAEMYQTYITDKYSFAWAMLGYEQFNYVDSEYGDISESGENIGLIIDGQDSSSTMMTWVEEQAYNLVGSNISKIKGLYDAYFEAGENDKKEALAAFRDGLYSNKECQRVIFKLMNVNKQDATSTPIIETEESIDNLEKIDQDASFDKNKFDYYVKLFEQIHNANGYMVLQEQYQNGDDGNTWFNNMVNSGRVIISELQTSGGSKGTFKEISIATSTSTNYLQKVQDDTELKKAEAEYEYELNTVNAKDTKFDNELNKLETERTAITKEIDSIDKVKNDNIERTFGIFS